MVDLVKIEQGRTSFFSGRDLFLAVGDTLEKDQLEFYRTNHTQLALDAGAASQEVRILEVGEDVLEDLIENSIFLHEHVLRGSSRAEWLAKSADLLVE